MFHTLSSPLSPVELQASGGSSIKASAFDMPKPGPLLGTGPDSYMFMKPLPMISLLEEAMMKAWGSAFWICLRRR